MLMMLTRTLLLFCVVAVMATSGRAQDCPPPEDPGCPDMLTGNSLGFKDGSPSSTKAGEVVVSGTIKTGTDWECTQLTIEAYSVPGNVLQGAHGIPNPKTGDFGPITITKVAAGSTRVKLTAEFQNTKTGKKQGPVELSSSSFTVQ